MLDGGFDSDDVAHFFVGVGWLLSLSIALFFVQDPVPIYWANIATVVACYGYGFTVGKPDGGGDPSAKSQPKWLKFIFKVRFRQQWSSISLGQSA